MTKIKSVNNEPNMADDTVTNQLQLTTFHLKLITLIAMLIDHIGWVFVAAYSMTAEIMHTVGRLVAPMMAYFLVMGLCHTQNQWAYLGRLLAFAVLSQPIFMAFQYVIGSVDIVTQVLWGNVLFSLAASLAALMIWQMSVPMTLRVLGVLAMAMIAEIGEYGAAMVMWVMVFEIFKHDKLLQLTAYALSVPLAHYLIYGWALTVGLGWMNVGMFFALPLIYYHTGQQGRRLGGRYFFYLFYPIHLLMLVCLAQTV